MRKQLEYHWNLGCYDEERGKLRESFSRDGTPAAREPYIDNGHPYWTMLGFAFYGIKPDDSFWTAPDEQLPVEKGDFVEKFDGPKFLLSGNQRTGEVKWVMAQNSAKREPYRDKYSKFSWSSHFAFNSSADPKLGMIPLDQALVLSNIFTDERATRAPNGVIEGKLLPDGVETRWWARIGETKIEVTSRVRLIGEFEERTHRFTVPPELRKKLFFEEGSYTVATPIVDKFYQLARSASGVIGAWSIRGYGEAAIDAVNDQNLIHKAGFLLRLRGTMLPEELPIVAALFYASPNPPPLPDVLRRAEELIKAWKE